MKEAVLALREIDDDQKIWVFVGMDRKIAEEASSQGIKIDEKVVQDGPPGGAPGRGVSSGLYVAGHPYHAGWYAMRHRGNSRTTRPIKESGVVAIRVRKGDLKLPPETTGPGSSGNRFATENGEPIDTAEALVNAHYGCVIEHDIPAEDIVYIAPRRRSKNQMQQTPGEDQDWIMDGYSAITHPSTGDAKTYFLMGGRLRHDPNY